MMLSSPDSNKKTTWTTTGMPSSQFLNLDSVISHSLHQVSFALFFLLYGIFLHELLVRQTTYWPLICGSFWSTSELYYAFWSPLRKNAPSKIHYGLYASVSILVNTLSVWHGYGTSHDELAIFPLQTRSQRIVAAICWCSFWAFFQYAINRPFHQDLGQLTKIKYINYLLWPITQMLMCRLPTWKPSFGTTGSIVKPSLGLFVPFDNRLVNCMMVLLVGSTASYGICKVPITRCTLSNYQKKLYTVVVTPEGLSKAYVKSIVISSIAVFSLIPGIHKMSQRIFTMFMISTTAMGYAHLFYHIIHTGRPCKKRQIDPYTLHQRRVVMSEKVDFQNHHKLHEGFCLLPECVSWSTNNLLGYCHLKHHNPILRALWSASEYGGVAVYASGGSLRSGAATCLLLLMPNLLDYTLDAMQNGYYETRAKRTVSKHLFSLTQTSSVFGTWCACVAVYAYLFCHTPLVGAMQCVFMLFAFLLYPGAKRLFVGSKVVYNGIMGAIAVTTFPLLQNPGVGKLWSMEHALMLLCAGTRLAASEIVVDTFDHRTGGVARMPTISVAYGLPAAIRIACTLYGLSALLSWFVLSGNLTIPIVVWSLGGLCAYNRLEWAHMAPILFVAPFALECLSRIIF